MVFLYIDMSMYIYICVCTPIQHHSLFWRGSKIHLHFLNAEGPLFWVKAMKIILVPLSRTFEQRIYVYIYFFFIFWGFIQWCHLRQGKFLEWPQWKTPLGLGGNSPCSPLKIHQKLRQLLSLLFPKLVATAPEAVRTHKTVAVKNLEKMTSWWLSHPFEKY